VFKYLLFWRNVYLNSKCLIMSWFFFYEKIRHFHECCKLVLCVLYFLFHLTRATTSGGSIDLVLSKSTLIGVERAWVTEKFHNIIKYIKKENVSLGDRFSTLGHSFFLKLTCPMSCRIWRESNQYVVRWLTLVV